MEQQAEKLEMLHKNLSQTQELITNISTSYDSLFGSFNDSMSASLRNFELLSDKLSEFGDMFGNIWNIFAILNERHLFILVPLILFMLISLPTALRWTALMLVALTIFKGYYRPWCAQPIVY